MIKSGNARKMFSIGSDKFLINILLLVIITLITDVYGEELQSEESRPTEIRD